ncbi:MAG: hypothetical protein PVJ42_02835 [bacterium]|jgi:hypothetical protein
MNQYARVLLIIAAAAIVMPGFGAASADGTVTLLASDDCYAVGDTVSFTLANGLDSAIHMPHVPVWSVWDTGADSVVYPQDVFWVVVSLPADSSATYKWPQIDYHLNQVSQGLYRVKVTYSPTLEPWNPSFTVQDSFYVGGASDVELRTWGRVKSLYR